LPLHDTPDLLLIGHFCHDKLPDASVVPGGAAAYSGLLAAKLGYKVAALTSFGPDFLFQEKFSAIQKRVVPSACTTIFENIYNNGARTQYLHAKAANLTPGDLPLAWKGAKAVILCPIADEVDFSFVAFFENAVTCVCPQGWMRQWGLDKKVSPKALGNWQALAAADIICMSENDVACDWDLIENIGEMATLLVVTQGAKGATVYQKGKKSHYPAFPAKELDPTGAGDVFSAAFTIRYALTRKVGDAMAFAHAAASLSVEGKGMGAIPDLEAVEKRFAEYLSLV
jgi:sugar/nucleoside kinase (ribokinase family)